MSEADDQFSEFLNQRLAPAYGDASDRMYKEKDWRKIKLTDFAFEVVQFFQTHDFAFGEILLWSADELKEKMRDVLIKCIYDNGTGFAWNEFMARMLPYVDWKKVHKHMTPLAAKYQKLSK